MARTKQAEPQIISEPKPPMPDQKLPQPGLEAEMKQRPRYEAPRYRPAGKLDGKTALITGGDSGIGRAVAVLYAREGAAVASAYVPSRQVDADETADAVRKAGKRCLQIPGTLEEPQFCRDAVERTVREFGSLDVLVSNAA